MKKFLFTTTVAFSLVVCHAQVIEKGKRIIGGSFSFGLNTTRYDSIFSSGADLKSRSFSIFLSPAYGKALKNNLVLGFRLSAGYGSATNMNPGTMPYGESKLYSVGGGIFLERFFPVGKGFSFAFAPVIGADYTLVKNELKSGSAVVTTGNTWNYSVGIGAAPAFNYSISKKLLAQIFLNDFVQLRWSKQVNEIQSGSTLVSRWEASHVNFSSSVSTSETLSPLHFGFRYIF